jgi:acetyl-CoA carboxylase biotin carboxyl carrier protein
MNDDDVRLFQSLLELVREHDLDALRVRMGDTVVEIVQREPAANPVATGEPAASGIAPPNPAGPVQQTGAAPVAGANVKHVIAPIVGVFYRSAAPGIEPFVQTGDRVVVGQVLCILEAMKLMNEITSDFAGVVTRIIPENGELVSIGQDMIWIET